MKRIIKKTLIILLAAVLVCACFSGCTDKVLEEVERLLFADIRLVNEPTLTVLQEEDGEYTAIVEGYAKNYDDKIAFRSEAWAHYYDVNGESISDDMVDIARIDKGEIWHFYIRSENLLTEPVRVNVHVFEDL